MYQREDDERIHGRGVVQHSNIYDGSTECQIPTYSHCHSRLHTKNQHSKRHTHSVCSTAPLFIWAWYFKDCWHSGSPAPDLISCSLCTHNLLCPPNTSLIHLPIFIFTSVPHHVPFAGLFIPVGCLVFCGWYPLLLPPLGNGPYHVYYLKAHATPVSIGVSSSMF